MIIRLSRVHQHAQAISLFIGERLGVVDAGLVSLIILYNENFDWTPSPALVPRAPPPPRGRGPLTKPLPSPPWERGKGPKSTPALAPLREREEFLIESLPSVAAATEGGERSEPGEGVPRESGLSRIMRNTTQHLPIPTSSSAQEGSRSPAGPEDEPVLGAPGSEVRTAA
jgi:hypothetical protein